MRNYKLAYDFKNLGNKTGAIKIYGVITDIKWFEDDVTVSDFEKQLSALGEIDLLNVFINSPGGNVFEGIAINNILKRHPAAKAVYIDGIAASIASVIAMAGDEVIMPKNTMMMIHNPMSIAYGYAEDMRKAADMLDKVKEPIKASYLSRVNIDDKKLSKLMDQETWLTSEEAIAMGFADKTEGEKDAAATVENTIMTYNGQEFDLSAYKAFPKNILRPVAKAPEPAAAPAPAIEPVPAPGVPAPVAAIEPDFTMFDKQMALNNLSLSLMEVCV
jgi:ATP-dependent Clp protease, protease subunit